MKGIRFVMSKKLSKKVKVPTPTTPDTARFLTVKDTASYLSATVWFVRRLAWERKVAHVRLGKRVLFDKADLDRYIQSQKIEAA